MSRYEILKILTCSFLPLIEACAPDLNMKPRPDVVVADLDPKADRLPFPFDGLAETNPSDVRKNGFEDLCNLSWCPKDPDERPLSEQKCTCVDFQEWDDQELSDAKARAGDPALDFEWTVKRKLHLLDGFPVTGEFSASFSNKVDLQSLDQSIKVVRSWDGEQQAAASDVPKFSARIEQVDYKDPDNPDHVLSRWLAFMKPGEPLLQRKTYLMALRAKDPDTSRPILHGSETAEIPAYTITQRFLPGGRPNPQCDAALDQTRCKVFNDNCITPPSLGDETCMVYWPVVQDAATWFALSSEPLCEYDREYDSQELLDLYKEHKLPKCLRSRTAALEDDDASDLEELRVALNEALDDEAIQTSLNLDRNSTALIWSMTTQSIAMDMQRARAALYSGSIPDDGLITRITRSVAGNIPGHVSAMYKGTLAVPDFRGEQGLLQLPLPDDVQTLDVPFMIFLPITGHDCNKPFKSAIVIHGAGGSKQDAIGIAPSLADKCIAVVALDLPGHGEHPIPKLWDDDPFLITGNLEQAVVEQLQAVRAITSDSLSKALEKAEAGPGILDDSPPGLVAGSLGAITGSVVLAVEPDVMVGVLSAFAGGATKVIQAFEKAGYAPSGITDQLAKWSVSLGPRKIDVASWVLERIDPAAYARAFRFRRMMAFKDLLRREDVPMTNKKILFQIPEKDEVLPAGAAKKLAEEFGAYDPATIVNAVEVDGGHRVLFDQGQGHDHAASQAALFISSAGTEVEQ
ncbi:MAG: alpha/beta fold hydrolase [Deltaproteobacteria bacterium]|nr:alpha/beta fold hydrolase [Deltaproteobacteria bacterium]